jgi:hypothetical protein
MKITISSFSWLFNDADSIETVWSLLIIINEYGAVNGIISGKETVILGENPA